MEAPAPCYEYVPLMPDGSTFRIISILPGFGNDPLVAFFLEVPIHSKPKYTALSYNWGDATVVDHVWFDKRVIGVGENLSNAMKRLREPAEVVSCWIDALCINQADKAEKSTQIPLMRRIYQQAELVSIYLGEQADGSEMIPTLSKRIMEAFEKSKVVYGEPPYDRQIFSDWDQERWGLPEEQSPVWDIFRNFLRRPWFTRVWIIQEVVLAQDARVVCGDWYVTWTALIQVFSTANRIELPIFPIGEDQKSGADSKAVFFDRGASMRILIFVMGLGAFRGPFVPWKLVHLLHRGRAALATNPRDYCYGFMGLSEELDEPSLRADYSLPVRQVYLQFARYFIESGNGVELLYNASGHDLELPSWVPDWSCRRVIYPRICPDPRRHVVHNMACFAAVSSKPSIRIHTTIPDVLVVKGIMIDRIETLGKQYLSMFMDDEERDRDVISRCESKLQTYFTDHVDINTSAGRVKFSPFVDRFLVGDCIAELIKLVQNDSADRYLTGESYETAIWKTLRCNMASGSMTKAPESYSKQFDAFNNDMKLICPSWKGPEVIKFNEEDEAASFDNGRAFIQGTSEYCTTRRRCRSKSGYIGQVPLETQVGDVIFLPLGSAVPFIIRQSGKETGLFKLLGECYIHGIMEGEAVRNSGSVTEDILLE